MPNSNAQYYAFNVDLKTGTINMIGFITTDQWYIEDNRAPKKDDRDQSKQPGPGAPAKTEPAPVIPVDPLPGDSGIKLRNKLPRPVRLQENQAVQPAQLFGPESDEIAAREAYVCRQLAPRERQEPLLAKK